MLVVGFGQARIARGRVQRRPGSTPAIGPRWPVSRVDQLPRRRGIDAGTLAVLDPELLEVSPRSPESATFPRSWSGRSAPARRRRRRTAGGDLDDPAPGLVEVPGWPNRAGRRGPRVLADSSTDMAPGRHPTQASAATRVPDPVGHGQQLADRHTDAIMGVTRCERRRSRHGSLSGVIPSAQISRAILVTRGGRGPADAVAGPRRFEAAAARTAPGRSCRSHRPNSPARCGPVPVQRRGGCRMPRPAQV
jgi:hypothetical protein